MSIEKKTLSLCHKYIIRYETVTEELEDTEIEEEVEGIFEEDSAFSNDDEALAAMEFYDSPDEME